MAAPTPVSALVHSSTLVTAGVYLLIRINQIIGYFNFIFLIRIIGVTTIIIARLRAIFENDIKKIVALSTLRQLGVIFSRVVLNSSIIVLFHLIVHAFFKALLFIATGNLIHNSNNYQDLRRIGSHLLVITFSKSVVILTKTSLMALPFFSAYYSKELILESISRTEFRSLFLYQFI